MTVRSVGAKKPILTTNNRLAYVTEFNKAGEGDHDQPKRGKVKCLHVSRGHKLEPDVSQSILPSPANSQALKVN